MLSGKGEKRKEGEKILLLPLPRAFRGRKRPMVSFKTTPFWGFALFFYTMDETTLFWTKHAVSFKRK
jgi:hypothetical protein